MIRPATAGIALLALAALALGTDCAGNPSVTFEVTLPGSVGGATQWVEVGALEGACPPAGELAGGLPGSGLLVRVAFAKGDPSPPAIGTLTKGSYAFVATARSADCAVLASGCSNVDLTSARDVSIALSPTGKGAGACESGEACLDARCVPTPGSLDAGPSPTCSLRFVGAGPLGDPMQAASDVVSAPVAAATPTGFLVAYREYDPTGGTARITLASVGADGALAIGAPTTLPGQCAGQDETDGVGLAYSSVAGLVASARPACGTASAGIDLLRVGANAAVSGSNFTATAGGKPVLSASHALALTSVDAGWLAYYTSRSAEVATITGLSVSTAPTPFGTGTSPSLAEVALSGQSVALLSGDTPGADGGAAIPTLSVSLGVGSRDAGAPVRFTGTWGALAASGTRAFVVSASGVSAQPVEWHVVDPSLASPLTATFAPPGTGTVAGGDVALAGGAAIFAVEQPGSVSLVAFDQASMTPAFTGSALLSADHRVPSMQGVSGGLLALASSATQVLVTWVTASTLGPDDDVGGWALYSCAP